MSASDQPASAEQLLREGRALRALAQRLLGDADGADDVVQEAVTTAWQQGIGAAGSRRWLSVVTQRLALARRRADARRRRWEEAAARPDAAVSAGEVAATSDVARRVAVAVDHLDEPFRSAVVLRYWQGLPPRAIARRLGVPVATVRSRLRRGLERLRHQLDDGPRGRAGWALPLAALSSPAAPFAATSLGVFAMGIAGKLAALLATLALVVWIWWPADASSGGAPGPVAGADDRAAATASVAVADAEETVDPLARVSRRVVEGVPGAVAELVVIGRLVDEASGSPLPGGFVEYVPGDGSAAERGDCDDQGRFRLALQGPLDRQVVAVWSEAAGHARERHALSRRDAVGDPPTVDLGELLSAPGTALTGTVRAQDGTPLEGARVFLATESFRYGVRAAHDTGALSSLLAIAVTDQRGRFRADHRLVPAGLETFIVAEHARGLGWRHAGITREQREVDVELTVDGATLTVRARRPDGEPLTGVRVDALPRFAPLGYADIHTPGVLQGDAAVAARFEARTDAEGVARFVSLPRGAGADWGPRGGYRLQLTADGFRTEVREVELGAADLVVDCVLGAAAPLQWTVRVADPDDAPIGGARVRVADREARTDATGTVVFADLRSAAAELRYVVEHPGHVGQSGTWQVRGESTATFTLTLEPATTLAAEVVDQDGVAVEGARVFVGGALRATTDASGRFAVGNLPRTPVEVSVHPPEPATEWEPIAAREPLPVADQPAHFVLVRRAAGVCELNVDVVDMVTGGAVSPEPASLSPIDERGFRAGDGHRPVEARLGLLRFEALPPGRYALHVAGRVTRNLRVDVGDRQRRLRVEVGSPGAIEGELVLGPGLVWPETITVQVGPDSNAARWLQPEGGELLTHEPNDIVWAARLRPATSTRFRLEGADPHRELTISASAAGLTGHLAFRVPPGEVARPRVVLRAAGRLVLRFAKPCPWHALRLHLEPIDGGAAPATRELSWLMGRESQPVVVPIGSYRWRAVTVDPDSGEEVGRGGGNCEVAAGTDAELVIDGGD